MPKNENSTFSTTLPVPEIERLLGSVFDGSTVEALSTGPLDAGADVALVASRQGGLFNRSPFGPGNAVTQVVVRDQGSSRIVQLTAVGTSFADGVRDQRRAGNAVEGLSAARQSPNLKFGRKMVAAVVEALQAADAGLRKTG